MVWCGRPVTSLDRLNYNTPSQGHITQREAGSRDHGEGDGDWKMGMGRGRRDGRGSRRGGGMYIEEYKGHSNTKRLSDCFSTV